MGFILRMAVEFRHESWCNQKIYKLLKKYNAAWVIACPPIGWSLKATGRRADSPSYSILRPFNVVQGRLEQVERRQNSGREAEEVTADFVYIRMHGSQVLFASKYTKKELSSLAQKIKKRLKICDVYVYFNNDFQGYAIENAKELLKLCREIDRIS